MLGSTVASVIINNFINELSCSETWYHWEEVRYSVSPIKKIPFYASYKVFVSLSIFCQMLLADCFFYFFFIIILYLQTLESQNSLKCFDFSIPILLWQSIDTINKTCLMLTRLMPQSNHRSRLLDRRVTYTGSLARLCLNSVFPLIHVMCQINATL